MKLIHIILIKIFLLFQVIAHTQTLHLVPIMGTDDKTIGTNAKAVLQKWITECSKIAQSTGMNFKHRDYMVIGSDFSKQRALSVVSNMDVNSNDVIFAYIFTHGYRAIEQQSKYPNLKMVYTSAAANQVEQSMLSSSYYFNKLREKNARLTILVVEACNTEVRGLGEPDRGYGDAKITAIEKELDVERYRQLFNVQGTVMVASASPGQAANAPPSGEESHFSENFRRQLKNMMSNQHNVSWENLLEQTAQATTSDVQALYPDPPINQVPIYDVNVSISSLNNNNNNPTTDLSVNDQRYIQYMLAGVRQYHAGQLQQAIANFRRALELKPNDRQAINNINVCQADSGALEFFNYNYESSCRTLTSMESQQYFTEQRYAYSQYALGILYLKGKGCSKNHQKAEYWLKTAANNGVQGACRVLNRLGVYDCN